MEKDIDIAWGFTTDAYNDKPGELFFVDTKQWHAIEMPVKSYVSKLSNQGIPEFSVGTGYFGRAYYNSDTKQVVVAHRGSDKPHHDIKDWFPNNFNILVGKEPPQFNNAISFRSYVADELERKYPGEVFTYLQTGHSLGGANAQFSAAYFKDKAITFDNPGMHDFIKNRFGIEGLNSYNTNAVEIIVGKPEFANFVGSYSNHVIPLDYSDFPPVLTFPPRMGPDFFYQLIHRQFAHTDGEIATHLYKDGKLNVMVTKESGSSPILYFEDELRSIEYNITKLLNSR